MAVANLDWLTSSTILKDIRNRSSNNRKSINTIDCSRRLSNYIRKHVNKALRELVWQSANY